ncbi:GerW family sporulation protein [Chloroflexota bacterium]
MEKDDVERIVKTTLGEMEKVLGSKTVIGDPITVGDSTIIPLLSIGFGFGGGGAGSGETKGEGGETVGAAGGAGGGVRPIAVIIIDKDGARIESLKGGMASALEKIGDSVPKIMDKFADKWGETKKEG